MLKDMHRARKDSRLLWRAHRFVRYRRSLAFLVRMTGANVSGTIVTAIKPTKEVKITTRYCDGSKCRVSQ